MKRSMPWSGEEGDSSSDESSTSGTNTESNNGTSNNKAKNCLISSQPSKGKTSEEGKKKIKSIGFEALSRHGYKGGLSVLHMPLPKDEPKQDWSWSNGKDRPLAKETEETFEERQKTRSAIIEVEQLRNIQTAKEKKNASSFAQKEKRKRDLGQASRGKSYVEEEKRLLRESGIYSGFDS